MHHRSLIHSATRALHPKYYPRTAPKGYSREITMDFPSEESGPVTGRSIIGAHHQGNRLAEELRINHPDRLPHTETVFEDKKAADAISKHARHRHVSTKWMWDQRNQLFASVNRKFLTILTSHLSPEEKTSRIADLYRCDVKRNMIHLRVQTYEDIFECILSSPHKEVKGSHAQIRRNVFTDLLFDMYHFMKSGFSAPTPKIVEYLMFSVSYATRTHPMQSPQVMESRAHKLWLDADKYSVICTRYTYTYYFEVCALRGIMHVALSRYIDAKERLGIQPDEAMCTTIIRGFVRNNQIEEAVGFISTMYAVPVDCFLLDAVIECFSLSTDPLAAFSVFRSQIERSGIHPTAFTFHYLMKACEKADDYSETMFVMRHMMDRSIQGTHTTLNLILKGLIALKKNILAQKLHARMRRKNVQVWEPIVETLPQKLLKNADKMTGNLADTTPSKTSERSFDEDYRRLTQWGSTSVREPNETYHQAVEERNETNANVQFPLRPLDEEHLREFFRLGRSQWIDMEYLCEFLLQKDIQVLSKKVTDGDTPKGLVRLCHGSRGLRRKVFRLVKGYLFPKSTPCQSKTGELGHEPQSQRSRIQKPSNISVLGVQEVE